MNLSVYFVTPELPVRPLVDLVLQAARGGANIIQLRDKTSTDAEMTRIAKQLVDMLRPFAIPLIINDRLEVALDSGAAGLHVGQNDMAVTEMRRALGPNRLLGLSIETLQQLRAMPAGIVDHIGVGPVRATATKADHAAPLGFESLAATIAASPVPAVAIGGLTLEDVAAVKRTGASGMALVSAIAAAENPEMATRAFVERWRQA